VAHLMIVEGIARFRTRMVALPLLLIGAVEGGALPRWLEISWVALKTGLFSIGGAYASVVFLEKGAVDQHHWLTSSQLLDGVALSVATPGPFMLFTTFVGYISGGVSGAVLATFFVFLPSFVLAIAGAHYIEQLTHNRIVHETLAGVSAAVVGVICVVSLDLAPSAIVDVPAAVIAVVAFLAIVLFKTDVALV